MEGLADFLDSLIGGVDLSFFAMAIGGLFWGLFILKPWVSSPHNNEILVKKCIHLIYIGSYALIITQLFKLALKLWLMNTTLGRWPLADLMQTTHFHAGFLRIIFALILTVFVNTALKHHIYSKKHWNLALLIALSAQMILLCDYRKSIW